MLSIVVCRFPRPIESAMLRPLSEWRLYACFVRGRSCELLFKAQRALTQKGGGREEKVGKALIFPNASFHCPFIPIGNSKNVTGVYL